MRDKTIQIKVSEEEKQAIEMFVIKKSLQKKKRITVSSFISESIMEIIKENTDE